MHAPAGGEAADQVDQRRAAARLGLGGGCDDHVGHRVGVEQVGLDQLEPLALAATRSSSRSTIHGTTTRQPSSSSRVTTAEPSPPVPPVTIAVASIELPSAVHSIFVTR